MASPGDELVKPESYDPVPDLAENIVGFTQYLSVSYWLGWAAEHTIHVNPWEWVAEQFAGDWKAVQESGLALQNLADFNTAFAGNITSGAAVMALDWTGEAASNAIDYFTRLATVLDQQVADLRSLGKEFVMMSNGMYEAANAIKGLIETLTDLLIAIGLAAAAAAASSWTVIGPLLAGGAAVATMTKAIGVWGDILDLHNNVWNAVQAFIGVVGGFTSTMVDLETVALPAGSYDHPGV
jgi:hypothetical protein